MDSLFIEYERLAVVYISRNKDVILVRDCQFSNNIALHGGAITINSPNWQNNKTAPNVVITKSTFSNNMAYFSGNAIYIKNSMPPQAEESR